MKREIHFARRHGGEQPRDTVTILIQINIYILITGFFLFGNWCSAQLTRTQIISNALPYSTFTWTAYADNVLPNGHSCNITGETVYAPTCWVAAGTNTSMPYCWGGFTTMAQHIAQMTAISNT